MFANDTLSPYFLVISKCESLSISSKMNKWEMPKDRWYLIHSSKYKCSFLIIVTIQEFIIYYILIKKPYKKALILRF
jgi:hypothetical protein